MKYMLQIRFNGAQAEVAKLSEDERQAVFAEYIAIGNTPGVLDGNQLQPAETAMVVTVQNGRAHGAPGPIQNSAPIDGYYLLETDDLESAIELAALVPAARMGGTVEVRATVEP